jgi:uncharacterized repeat protein (TIGR01451 family)
LGIAVDGTGAAYVTGQTASSQATFPETVGRDLTFNGGVLDAFVAKINPAGTALAYAGYIGGGGFDQGFGIAVDGSGAAYVTGTTDSTEATFPETVGPDLTFNGNLDGFVAKVNPAGTALAYAGYIGGGGNDAGFGIAVDGTGAAYVTGRTTSSEATFPETVGPDLTFNGNLDGFVAKISPAAAADLSIAKADSPDPVLVGETLTYTLTVTNAGPTPATDVVVTDTLPPSVTFSSATSTQGTCMQAGGTVTCSLGTLPANATATVTIEVIPQVKGTITDTATVMSPTPDPNPANNTDTEDTTVVALVGGAFGVRAEGPFSLTVGPMPLATLPPGGGSVSFVLASVSQPGLFDAALLKVSTQGGRANGVLFVDSSASVATADFLGGLIHAEAVSSSCHATLGGTTGSTSLAKLTVGGTPITVDPAPNTTVLIAGVGTLVLNEQSVDSAGVRTVNALHLHLDGGPLGSLGSPTAADVILSQSRCGIDP